MTNDNYLEGMWFDKSENTCYVVSFFTESETFVFLTGLLYYKKISHGFSPIDHPPGSTIIKDSELNRLAQSSNDNRPSMVLGHQPSNMKSIGFEESSSVSI